MNYIKVDFSASQDTSEIVMAMISEFPFDTFEETGSGLSAYMLESDWNDSISAEISVIANQYDSKYTVSVLPAQNWNSVWESNFEPVEIEDFCIIKAPFHQISKKFQYEITIQPQMSFGTGHHATTRLMALGMKNMEFGGKKVLDYGCGTGVLGFLAAKMNAKLIHAIDYDEWSFKNTQENALLNNFVLDKILFGGIEQVEGQRYDVILANINRNVLIENMDAISKLATIETVLLMSGFLSTDVQMLVTKAKEFGWSLKNHLKEDNWQMLAFVKIENR
jgi:ribosomal protein L11 methyltransferase